jgi:tetratricopeptide (TPR) repeat protein
MMTLSYSENWPISEKWNMPLIILFSFCIYANTLFYGFVLDDKVVYTENAYVQQGFKGLDDIFSKDTYSGYFKDSGNKSSVSGGRYRPLSLGFFAIEHQFFGNNAFIAHLLNVLFFCILCAIIYKVFQKLLSTLYPLQANWLAFIATILFAVHPLHTEVVANVKGLDEIWSLLFSMLALWILLKNPAKQKVLNYLGAAIMFLFALLSKENSIVFLILIPLGLYLFLPERKKYAWHALLPLGISAMIFVAIRTWIIGSDVIYASGNFLENPFLNYRGERLIPMNPADKFGTILYTLLKYIQLHIFPYPLTHDYAPKSIDTYSLFSPLPLLAIAIYLLLIILAFRLMKRKPVLSWSIFLFIIALLPTSNLFFSIGAYMGERYAFVSSLGFCLGLAYLLYYYVLPKSKLLFPVLIILISAFSIRSIARNTVWKDNLSLFNNDYNFSSNSAKLNSSLGYTLLETYRNSDDKEGNKYLLNQAIFHLNRAVKIYPKYTDCIYLLGNAYYLNKDFKSAVITYEKYIELNPADHTLLKNYQKALREYGRNLFFDEHNNFAATNVLLKSIKLDPMDDRAYELLGSAEAELGYLEKSLEHLLKSAELNPQSASTWANLYITYTRLGDKSRAQIAINKGMEIDKDVVKKLMSVRIK